MGGFEFVLCWVCFSLGIGWFVLLMQLICCCRFGCVVFAALLVVVCGWLWVWCLVWWVCLWVLLCYGLLLLIVVVYLLYSFCLVCCLRICCWCGGDVFVCLFCIFVLAFMVGCLEGCGLTAWVLLELFDGYVGIAFFGVGIRRNFRFRLRLVVFCCLTWLLWLWIFVCACSGYSLVIVLVATLLGFVNFWLACLVVVGWILML